MTIILTSDELASVTSYRTPKRQLAELHRQGFYRARIAATGNVILERAQRTAHSTQAQTAAYIRHKSAIRSMATR